MSMYAIPGILVSIPAGLFADYYGYRRVGLLSLFVTILGTLSVAMTSVFPSWRGKNDCRNRWDDGGGTGFPHFPNGSQPGKRGLPWVFSIPECPWEPFSLQYF